MKNFCYPTLVILLWAGAVQASEFNWLNVRIFPDDLTTTEDAWTAARVNDDDFISYRIAADDFVLTQRTRITEVGFYSADFDADILGGDWYIYAYGGDDHPGELIAAAYNLPLLHEDSGIVNSSFGTVYRNTMAADVTLDPGRYFIAFRSVITFAHGGGKHSILTTRFARSDARAQWNFTVYTDGVVGGPWVTMDVFNFVVDQEWAFFLNGETLGDPCDGDETLTASCAGKGCGDRVKAVLKKAAPGVTVTFTLDGAQARPATVNARGKAKAKWCPVETGEHSIRVVECQLEADAHCP